MKFALLAMTLLAMTHVCRAAELADGLYWQTDGKSGQKITTLNRGDVFVGEKWDVKPLEVMVSSQDNANTNFYVSLKCAYEIKISDSFINTVLICGGRSYAQGGSGSNGKEISFADYSIAGQEGADAVAKYFGTTTRVRQHPGYAFRVSFTPDKKEYAPGEEVAATLRIENISDKTVAFQKGGHNRAERDTQYHFTAQLNGKSVPDIGTDMKFGGLSVNRVLKPNEIFEDKIVLNKWFAFKDAGTYDILGSYLMEFFEPGEKHYFMIWQDYATAEFRVTIKTPAAKAEK